MEFSYCSPFKQTQNQIQLNHQLLLLFFLYNIDIKPHTPFNIYQILFQMIPKYPGPTEENIPSELKIPSLNFFRQTFYESVVGDRSANAGLSQTSMPYLYSTVLQKHSPEGIHFNGNGSVIPSQEIIAENGNNIEVMLNRIDIQLKVMKEKNQSFSKLSTPLMSQRTSLNHQIKKTAGSHTSKTDRSNMENRSLISKSFEKTSYNEDFSPNCILNELREQNKIKIIKIKQYFRNLRRGGEIPDGFDMKKSVSQKTERTKQQQVPSILITKASNVGRFKLSIAEIMNGSTQNSSNAPQIGSRPSSKKAYQFQI